MGGHIDRARNVVAGDKELDRPGEVEVVNQETNWRRPLAPLESDRTRVSNTANASSPGAGLKVMRAAQRTACARSWCGEKAVSRVGGRAEWKNSSSSAPRCAVIHSSPLIRRWLRP